MPCQRPDKTVKFEAISDCHTHAFPTELAENPRRWATARGEHYWADLVAPKKQRSIQDWADPGTMLAAMDACGVKKAVLLGWYWENETTCRWHNEVIAKWVCSAPDRFIGFASILPNKNTRSQLEAAEALGLQGVGELHMGVQGFNASSPSWQELAEWCCARHWPVNLHATEAAGQAHPGSKAATPLQELVALAVAAPDLKIIFAHWGGGLPFFEQNPKLRSKLRNVYYDCSASPLLYDPTIFRSIADITGPEKLLFGSDYPLRLYPSRQKKAGYTEFLDEIVHRSGLNESELKALLGGNLRSILTQP